MASIGLCQGSHGGTRSIYNLRQQSPFRRPNFVPETAAGHCPGSSGSFKISSGVLGSDLFDIHAACRRSHKDRTCRAAIENNAQVEFAFNRKSFFDQQSLNHASFRSGLMRHKRHAQASSSRSPPLRRHSSRF